MHEIEFVVILKVVSHSARGCKVVFMETFKVRNGHPKKSISRQILHGGDKHWSLQMLNGKVCLRR